MLKLTQLWGRCCGVRKNKEDIIRKTIPFGPSEKDLYDYAVKQCELDGIKFATYVKKLIRESRDNSSLDSLLEKKLDKYFSDKNFTINNPEIKKQKFDKEDKKALLNFMKK